MCRRSCVSTLRATGGLARSKLQVETQTSQRTSILSRCMDQQPHRIPCTGARKLAQGGCDVSVEPALRSCGVLCAVPSAFLHWRSVYKATTQPYSATGRLELGNHTRCLVKAARSESSPASSPICSSTQLHLRTVLKRCKCTVCAQACARRGAGRRSISGDNSQRRRRDCGQLCVRQCQAVPHHNVVP